MLTWLPGFFRSSYLWSTGTHKHVLCLCAHACAVFRVTGSPKPHRLISTQWDSTNCTNSSAPAGRMNVLAVGRNMHCRRCAIHVQLPGLPSLHYAPQGCKGLTAEARRSLQSCAAGRAGWRLTPVDVALLSRHLAGGVPGGHIQDAGLGQDLQCYECHVGRHLGISCCQCQAGSRPGLKCQPCPIAHRGDQDAGHCCHGCPAVDQLCLLVPAPSNEHNWMFMRVTSLSFGPPGLSMQQHLRNDVHGHVYHASALGLVPRFKGSKPKFPGRLQEPCILLGQPPVDIEGTNRLRMAVTAAAMFSPLTQTSPGAMGPSSPATSCQPELPPV